MVARRAWLPVLALLLPALLRAQNYSVDDTVTEYPNKGTYYHNKFEGRKTANGEVFDQNGFTAAHWKIKLGTYVMVTNRNTGLQVIVRVNDRCPRRGVFDMSRRAAHSIGIKGCQPVTVRLLPTGQGYEERWAAQDALFDSVPSRLAPGVKAPAEPRPAVADAAPGREVEKSVDEPTPPPAPKPAPRPAVKPAQAVENVRFNLLLGEVGSHGEAFSQMERIPQAYRDKALVDSTSYGTLRLVLDVRLPRGQAQELSRTLDPTFPNCRMLPAE